mmetsp:Transcript_6460/g.20925  ORF Transcript_6460/g.20925 Transcript_6460/m.20925 type:complete len:250 (-) Transcript_6460:457-1206(-)
MRCHQSGCCTRLVRRCPTDDRPRPRMRPASQAATRRAWSLRLSEACVPSPFAACQPDSLATRRMKRRRSLWRRCRRGSTGHGSASYPRSRRSCSTPLPTAIRSCTRGCCAYPCRTRVRRRQDGPGQCCRTRRTCSSRQELACRQPPALTTPIVASLHGSSRTLCRTVAPCTRCSTGMARVTRTGCGRTWLGRCMLYASPTTMSPSPSTRSCATCWRRRTCLSPRLMSTQCLNATALTRPASTHRKARTR